MPRGRRNELPPVRKSLGQHFLRDRRILSRIVDVLAPGSDETVVEIGPGRGALTDLLAERAGRVIAIEYDRALAALLRERYAANPAVVIVETDVLQADLGALTAGPYALIGNVPYYITTPILFHALVPPRAQRAVYLVQREVAERMQASPGGRVYGALSVNLQVVASVEIAFTVPAGAFTPPPKVDSAVVRVVPLSQPLVRPDEEEGVRELVQRLFGMRRKQMRRAIRSVRPASADEADRLLATANVPPDARPETLAPDRFVALYRILSGL